METLFQLFSVSVKVFFQKEVTFVGAQCAGTRRLAGLKRTFVRVYGLQSEVLSACVRARACVHALRLTVELCQGLGLG